MSSQEFSRKFSHYLKLMIKLSRQFVKNIPDLVREFKSTIIIIVSWIVVSEMAGYSVFDLFRSIFRLLIYPLNWILFKTQFNLIRVPEVFILLIPFVILITFGLLIIISTED